jgi:phosphatidylglycerol:prolipoprotein diacylglycerol transferase
MVYTKETEKTKNLVLRPYCRERRAECRVAGRMSLPGSGFKDTLASGQVHPIAFEFGGLTIHWYGVMVALGFLSGLWLASRQGAREGLGAEAVLDLGPWLIAGAIAGARLLFVGTFWREQFAGRPFWEVFEVWHGGLVYYGGLIGASLAGMLYARGKGLPLWKLADILAPGVALGSFFGRWGCLMNGCCYGRPTRLPWGIQFPVGHETHPHNDGLPHMVHPTEIYDSLLNLALFAGLAWFYKRRKFDGQVFALYLVCYAVLRSFVECFRGDYPASDLVAGWITPAQLASVGTLLAGALLLALLPKGKEARMEKGG